ncbi:hypothetical protein [Umezawaea sp. Da 62-37]|uniref:hypothetical protein n=1 Tax=Umezawaea sp. Da 62-37 TaxID=3075927 RepID=UPI0028F73B3A|nr:hypothetical protein [Umezawaea sp. Da 62-37]WNV85213.1 hypothetical protein RM788_44985 [Umezawaea sp. Da 62-37]
MEEKATAHLDVLELAASTAVGGGGLFAPHLAARRRRTQELELAQREKVQAHAGLHDHPGRPLAQLIGVLLRRRHNS